MGLKKLFKIANNFVDFCFGLRIQPSAEKRLKNMRDLLIKEFQCDTVIDVGANSGEWATKLRKSGFLGDIISYEPSPKFHELAKKARGESRWKIHNIALSNYAGVSHFFIASNNGLSSSTLSPKKILDQNFEIKFHSTIEVPTNRLDCEVFEGDNLYLKIDVQGAEFNVLQGAFNLLPKISVIEFESSLLELYDGEKNHYVISRWLNQHGFFARQIVVTHWDKNLATVSIDSIFSRL